MIKYDVLLCSSMLYDCYVIPISGLLVSDECLNANRILRNHRVVLSDLLMKMYRAYAIEKNILLAYETFKQWYADQATKSTSMLVYIQDDLEDADNIDDVLLSLCKNITRPIVFCGCCSNWLKFLYDIQPITVKTIHTIDEKVVDNQLLRNMMPFFVDTKKGEKTQSYLDWFNDMLNGEKNIKIFNRYAYKSNEFKVMIDYIIQQASPGTNITLYVDHKESGTPKDDVIRRNRRIKQIAYDKQLNCTVYSYEPEKGDNMSSYHDRRVFLGDSVICFSAGFDCLSPLTCRELTKGNLEISHKECDVINVVNSILKEHSGYRVLWDNTKEADDLMLSI